MAGERAGHGNLTDDTVRKSVPVVFSFWLRLLRRFRGPCRYIGDDGLDDPNGTENTKRGQLTYRFGGFVQST